jgi:hypothetical protein
MRQERKPPLRLLQEEALTGRISKTHPLLPKILNSIGARKGGYRGEQDIDYHLTFLPQNKYTILRDLRLIDQFPFQIDTVLLSTQLILAIETKNISGTLFFDKNSNQMIRKINDVEEGFSNPLLQVQRQTHQLKNWLLQHKFPPIPIEYLVTISQPKTILKSNHPQIFNKVIHTDQVVDKIISIEKSYPSHIVDEKGIRRISKMLIKEDTSSSNNILASWGITPQEIITGVACPACHRIPMIRLFSTWYCPSCKEESKDAHIQALKDYFLLMGSTITNKQCREFLHISSRRTSEQLLKSMNLTKVGSTKGIYYTEGPF